MANKRSKKVPATQPNRNKVVMPGDSVLRRRADVNAKALPDFDPGIWILIAIGCLIIVFFFFYPLTGSDFLCNWDDRAYIVENPDITQISLASIIKVFSSYYVSNYQPLAMLSYMIDFYFSGLNPGVFHTMNILWHIVNVLLVIWWVFSMTKKMVPAIVVGILFALHPMHVESVAWISERKDLLYSSFYIASLIAYTKYILNDRKESMFYLAILMFLFSCLCKSMAVTLPLVLIIVDYYFDEKISIRSIIKKAPFFVIAFATGLIALHSQSGLAMNTAPDFPLIQRFFLSLYAIIWYVIKLFLPFNLSAIHYYPVKSGESLPWYIYGAPFLFVVLVIAVSQLQNMRKLFVFGFLFFIIAILPVVQLVPVGNAVVSERYTYLPYIGLFFILAMLPYQVSWLKNKVSLWQGALLFIAVFFGFVSRQRCLAWKNEVILFTDLCNEYPHAAHAYWLKGNTWRQYNQMDSAIVAYNHAIGSDSKYAMAYMNRALCLYDKKQYAEALPDYDKTVSYAPDYAAGWYNRANDFMALKQVDQAIESYKKAIYLDSTFALAYKEIANALLINLKDYNGSLPYFDKALKFSGNNLLEALNNKGVALYNLSKHDEACQCWEKAFQQGYKESGALFHQYCK